MTATANQQQTAPTRTSNAVALRDKKADLGTMQHLLEQYKSQIAMALPHHMTPERMIRIALTALSTTPALQKCNALSVCAAVVQSSVLGLEINTALGEAYLVPYKDTCQLIPGYQGLMKLVRNSGELRMINAQAVYEKDTFEFEDGLDPYLVHKRFKGDDRGLTVAYWAGAVLKDGGKQFVVMTKKEAEAHGKRFSKTYGNGPWNTDFDAMALKTCIRKLVKFLPKSIEAQAAVNLDERAEAGVQQRFTVEVPMELQPIVTDEPDAADPIPEPKRSSDKRKQDDCLDPWAALQEKYGDLPTINALAGLGYENWNLVPAAEREAVCASIDKQLKS